jgi:hypothetical protein
MQTDNGPAAGLAVGRFFSRQRYFRNLPHNRAADTLKEMQRPLTPILAIARVASFVALTYLVALHVEAFPWKQKPQSALRWAEGQPGCTFSRGDDGKYRYALWTPDYGVTVAVDSQELEKLHRRVEPFFSLELTVRYRGKGKLELAPGSATLEFVRHYKVVQSSLDPDSFAQKTQNDADERDHEAQREIEKHPERKEEREKFLQTYQKEVTEFLDFLTKRTLPAMSLDPANAEASGWELFSVNSKWIGGWKKPEEFVLRLPLAGRMLEFPFSLPAAQGDLILRKRPE